MSHSSRRVFPYAFQSLVFRSVAVTGFVGCFVALQCQTVAAQSSVVQLPDSSNGMSNHSRVTRMVSSQLPNDLPEALLQTERALARPVPSGWGREVPLEQLMGQMQRSGLRVRLDDSALDNGLDLDTKVSMPLKSVSIAENLEFLLRRLDCDYRITAEGVIDLRSRDDLYENNDRMNIALGSLAKDYAQGEELMDLIQETIDPDSWEANGGNGRMRVMLTRRGMLLSISQSYRNQVQIRKQLVSMLGLGSGVSSPEYVVGAPSRAVALPKTEAEIQSGWAAGRSFRRGRGVGGLGGGVF